MLMKICEHCGKQYPAGEACPCQIERRKSRHRQYDKSRRNKDAAAFYHSRAWTRIRQSVKARSNGLDELEWSRGHAVQGTLAHHIEPLEDAPDKALDIYNLVWVSAKTHEQIHAAYEKSDAEKKQMQQALRRAIRH